MKIQYCSDLHLEFSQNRDFLLQYPLKPEGDILVLAGDIALFSEMHTQDIDLKKLIVLNHIYTGQKLTFQQLEKLPFVNHYQLRKILTELQEIEFIETTGRTSGLKYIIHKSKLVNIEDKIGYSKLKKQERAEQIESIIRYLKTAEDINNEAARKILNIPDTNASYVSRLFAEMVEKGQIEIADEPKHNQRTYKLTQ